jgi:hypothetical protein
VLVDRHQIDPGERLLADPRLVHEAVQLGLVAGTRAQQVRVAEFVGRPADCAQRLAHGRGPDDRIVGCWIAHHNVIRECRDRRIEIVGTGGGEKPLDGIHDDYMLAGAASPCNPHT